MSSGVAESMMIYRSMKGSGSRGATPFFYGAGAKRKRRSEEQREVPPCTNSSGVYEWGDRIEIVYKKQNPPILLWFKALRCIRRVKKSTVQKKLGVQNCLPDLITI
jgi:hypothetical protein